MKSGWFKDIFIFKGYIEGNNLFVEINPTPIFLNWHDDSPLFVEVAK